MKTRTRFLLGSLLADLIALLIAGVVASLIVYDRFTPWSLSAKVPALPPNSRPMIALLVIGVGVGVWVALHVIDPWISRPNYARPFLAVVIAGGVVAGGTFLLRTYFSRPYVLWTLMIWLVLALVHVAIQRRKPWIDRMVLVTKEKELAQDLAESSHAEVIDIIDPRGPAPSDSLPRDVSLIVDLRSVLSDSMAQFVSSSTLAGLDVRPFSQVYEEHTERIPLIHLAEGWEISVPLGRRAIYAPFKRLIEVVLTIVTAPLWLIIAGITAIVVKLDSPGPAIFKQVRTGIDDEPFTIYKFRTMVVGADDDGPQFTTIGDPRITRVGNFLRTTRIDEIPQLWNVLKGDLALVGPRAEQVAFAQQFQQVIPFYRYRHLVRPGITGWAQVNSGYAADLEDTIEKLTYDLYYVRHMSPWLDWSVVWRSVWTVVRRRGQ